MNKTLGKWIMVMMFSYLFLVLYCEKKHGTGKELEDFSSLSLGEAPVWAKEGIIYQVFPRVFTREGTFVALEKKLDYIKSLGVDIIWLMPVFPIGEKDRKGILGSPYSVSDFREINPDYGNKKSLKSLVKAIHQQNMKVILGIVPHHASNDNVLLNNHPEWFKKDEKGNLTREVKEWSDVTDFNYQNPQMREYMLETMVYWIKEFDIDGYRCDVAGMVPFDFWKVVIPKLREVKSDIFLLAEWEDPKLLLQGFNSEYGWTEFFLLKEIRRNKKRTVAAIDLIYEKDKRYPRGSLPMRFLENHDLERSMKVFGPEAIEAYATFIFTIPGVPLIYGGQEIGETKKPSLFEKSVISWGNSDSTLLTMYKNLIELRKKYSCFNSGKFIPLQTTSFSGSVGAFLREDQHTVALVVMNLRNKSAQKVIVNMDDELRKKLQHLTFMNYLNKEDQLSFSEIVIDELLPFETMVYVALKQVGLDM